jgi:hypothetical protein
MKKYLVDAEIKVGKNPVPDARLGLIEAGFGRLP